MCVFVCSTSLGFSGGSADRYCCMYVYVADTYVPGISRLPRYVYDTRYVLCSRYVCTWYQPATQIRMYQVPGISRQMNVPPVDAHVWRQLHVSAVARCSDSYCILSVNFCIAFLRRYCRWFIVFGNVINCWSLPTKWIRHTPWASWLIVIGDKWYLVPGICLRHRVPGTTYIRPFRIQDFFLSCTYFFALKLRFSP